MHNWQTLNRGAILPSEMTLAEILPEIEFALDQLPDITMLSEAIDRQDYPTVALYVEDAFNRSAHMELTTMAPMNPTQFVGFLAKTDHAVAQAADYQNFRVSPMSAAEAEAALKLLGNIGRNVADVARRIQAMAKAEGRTS